MTDKPDSVYFQALLEEYKTLRNDIQQRIQFRFQISGLLLIAMSVLFPLGLQGEAPSSMPLFIYPVIALFLTLSWVHQGVIVIKLARYIRDEIEPKLPGLAWEQTIKRESQRFSGFGLLGTFAISGLIVISQILAITLGWAVQEQSKGTESDSLAGLLQIIAITATIITIVLLIVHGRMKR
ncbi:hypothetical protein KJ068_13640 [bacterium]|nr:hypothetical protein [bacterium]